MNYRLFQSINNLAGNHPFWDKLMIFVSKDALVIYALILLIMWLFGKQNFKYTVVYAVITAVFGLLINTIIGHIYYEPRPFVSHKVHLILAHAKDASFPSDHATGAFTIAFAVLLRHRKTGFVLLLLAILTGISRVYVGNHYPFDVLGSIVVSLVTSLVVFSLRGLLQPIPRAIVGIYNRIPLVPKNTTREDRINY
ncbi:undecaprenyl-diphosphatase [Bacillus sp. BRMEA1]|uniref:undecaprenyl-diphosphatase n=1 Tax=Neobacillus endophyticus TaxID=2738405 RepID=UPI00156617DA|nr:undecaprenyl-diphosphatase [Neobacillus endophyticus]NRD78005.1 undecaprenyl-diphosphatase [Neobacillus endophyticus]